MKLKKIFIYILIPVIIISLSGCAILEKQTPAAVSKEKIVKVTTVGISTYPNYLYYFGSATPKEIKQLSMLVTGIVEDIYVTKGDYIETGATLAKLEDTQLNLAVNNAAKQVETAKLDYEKAVAAYDYYEDLYNKTLVLYESGVVSKSSLDEIKLQLDVQTKAVSQAESVYNQALIGYDSNFIQKSDTILTSDIDGYVVEVFNKPGELYAAGYPIMLVRGVEQIINVGLGQNDIKQILMGGSVDVVCDGETFSGTISNINYMPDPSTRTYNVEITLEDSPNLLLGEMCEAYFYLGDKEGLWIDITSINNDGEDYVYVVKDGRAVRKNITLYEIYQDKVRVEGLEANDVLITEGGNGLNEGYKVIVEGDIDE